MATRSITFYSVGNGNCCLMKLEDDIALAFDLHGSDDKSSYELVSPELRESDGKRVLDVLCVTHGDKDHCGGFREFKKAIESGKLVIGSIWHSDHDRREHEEKKDLPDDYLALQEEIDRRKEVKNPEFGDLHVALRNGDDESVAFAGMDTPPSLNLKTLHPYEEESDDDEVPDVNETGLVIRLTVSNLKILLPGDTGSPSWQDRIIPKTLKKAKSKDWADCDVFLASHHGSYRFFGNDREDVRDADPEPENYEALDYIDPNELVVSAESRFPTSKDASGDDPPHYAAWKWYHKWFRENRDVSETDKHPQQFRYTADGHLRLELGDDGWMWIDDWSPDDPDDGDQEDSDEGGDAGKAAAAGSIRFKRREGETRRGRDQFA